ncbi:hypothetical protein D4S03_06835 [bacterium]|nr:MAG: hypothetical protein D4S03_06835 [bacterium]
MAQEGKVVYTAKDKNTSKVFATLECLAAMCSHIPNRGEHMVRCYGFCNTLRDYSFRHLTFGTVTTHDLSLLILPQSTEGFPGHPVAGRPPVRPDCRVLQPVAYI